MTRLYGLLKDVGLVLLLAWCIAVGVAGIAMPFAKVAFYLGWTGR